MKILSASIVLLLLVGFLYQSYSSYVDSTSFDKRGEMIDIGDYSLYVEDIGTGKVTVIFDAGMGDDSSVWNKVVEEVTIQQSLNNSTTVHHVVMLVVLLVVCSIDPIEDV